MGLKLGDRRISAAFHQHQVGVVTDGRLGPRLLSARTNFNMVADAALQIVPIGGGGGNCHPPSSMRLRPRTKPTTTWVLFGEHPPPPPAALLALAPLAFEAARLERRTVTYNSWS